MLRTELFRTEFCNLSRTFQRLTRQYCIKMSDYFKVCKIKGKGFGGIATKDIPKGTLILQEKAQIFDYGGPFKSESDNAQWIKSIISSFNQMSEDNQKEFLTLHNDMFQDLSQSQIWTQHLHLYR